jgi:hypothetical protein
MLPTSVGMSGFRSFEYGGHLYRIPLTELYPERVDFGVEV